MEMTRMPVPVLDARERQLLAQLGEPYRRTPRRGKKSRTQEKEHRLAAAMLRAAGRGFARLQGEAARQMMSEAEILAAVRKTSGLAVYSAREVCFVRSYAVSRALRQCWTGHLRRALWQGEIEEIMPDKNIRSDTDDGQISKAISSFLREEKQINRNIFILKYFYFESIEDIANKYDFSESKVKSILFRTRNKLKSLYSKNHKKSID